MEREYSYFSTEDVKDKPASVKMDLEICELYYKVIEELLSKGDYENNIKIIRRFLLLFSHSNNFQSEKQNSFKKTIVPKKQLRELKQTFFYRILYIYWNGVCFSSAVACHFRTFLACSPGVLKEPKSKKNIRICSLGGGCLPDVIAMVKVLESMADANEYIDIRVSVVDIDKKWMITCITILQTLEHFRNATWEIDFTHADFTKPLSSLVIDMIKNADIISMMMLLPQVKGLKKRRRIV
ncbi:uncharacterized protein TNCV_4828361 [Trichonephila clavipes]|uniref:Uncharacterized protein n=1 Tax=Trichonephila clavipes TaxID=2585209 RepID=A0A8X6VN93_TRICX|nr:uncharacterized protein TNCV_4828361 [Trichonephila clavipes]